MSYVLYVMFGLNILLLIPRLMGIDTDNEIIARISGLLITFNIILLVIAWMNHSCKYDDDGYSYYFKVNGITYNRSIINKYIEEDTQLEDYIVRTMCGYGANYRSREWYDHRYTQKFIDKYAELYEKKHGITFEIRQ